MAPNTLCWSALSICTPEDAIPHTAKEDGEVTPMETSLPALGTPPYQQDADDEAGEAVVVYRASRVRFVVAAVFALFGLINQVQYVAYATIVRETEDKFGVNALQVNLLSLLIPVVYCLGVVPGCWLYNVVGLRHGQILGAGANAFASSLKLICVWAPRYPLVVVAQVFVAVGQIFYLSLPPLIAARWFPVEERTVATAACSLMGFVGMAVGMFASPRVVYLPDHADNGAWGRLMGTQFAVSVLVLLLMIALVPEKPKHKPSPTAAKEEGDAYIWKTLRRPFRNANMMALAVFFGLPVGFLTAVAALLTQIVEPFGIPEQHAGILAFAGILGGAANCAVVGWIVDRLRRYKAALLLLTCSVTVLLVPVAILMKTVKNNDVFAIAAYIIVPLLECLVLPLVPVAMELSVELTYPEPETASATVALLSMCFFSFVGMIVFSLILGDHPTKSNSAVVVIVTLVLCALSVVGLLFVKEDRRRLRHEHSLQRAEHCSAAEQMEPAGTVDRDDG